MKAPRKLLVTQKFVLRPLFMVLILGLILACETQDDNKIEQARSCLNNAAKMSLSDPTTAAGIAANSCEPFIANISTDEAGRIGVGIVLVEEQKVSSLQSVENAVKNQSGAVATAVAFLVFSSKSHVDSLTTYADRSGSPGSKELANIVSLAYLANAVSGVPLGSGSTATDIANAITALSTDATNGPMASNALLSAQQFACSSGDSSSLCTALTNAIGPDISSYTAILSHAASYVQGGG